MVTKACKYHTIMISGSKTHRKSRGPWIRLLLLLLRFACKNRTILVRPFLHFFVSGYFGWEVSRFLRCLKMALCILAERCAHFLRLYVVNFLFSLKNLRNINVFLLVPSGLACGWRFRGVSKCMYFPYNLRWALRLQGPQIYHAASDPLQVCSLA